MHHSLFPPERLVGERRESVSVCVPTLNEGPTIGSIVRDLVGLRDRGAIDQVVVADAQSADGCAEIAADAGAEVHNQADLMPELGPVLGKGDAMWRALTVLHGDVVVFVDGDSADFGPHFACGLAGPIVCGTGTEFVKGRYRRPFRAGAVTLATGGGRVTELTARPLLKLYFPELARFGQPLAGELAARRTLLRALPFMTGYGVEIALLIDVYRKVGIDAMAEVDLDVRQNRHQPLEALAAMADAVAATLLARAGLAELRGVERPAHATLGVPA